MIEVLSSAQTTSVVFTTTGQNLFVVIDTFQGTTAWSLEMLTPAGNWIIASNADDFASDGVWRVLTLPAGQFRFTGGDVGAQIWVEGAYVPGV